jgi:hypothetical protein
LMETPIRIPTAESMTLMPLLCTASSALPSPTLPPRLPNRQFRRRIHPSRTIICYCSRLDTALLVHGHPHRTGGWSSIR